MLLEPENQSLVMIAQVASAAKIRKKQTTMTVHPKNQRLEKIQKNL